MERCAGQRAWRSTAQAHRSWPKRDATRQTWQRGYSLLESCARRHNETSRSLYSQQSPAPETALVLRSLSACIPRKTRSKFARALKPADLRVRGARRLALISVPREIGETVPNDSSSLFFFVFCFVFMTKKRRVHRRIAKNRGVSVDSPLEYLFITYRWRCGSKAVKI